MKKLFAALIFSLVALPAFAATEKPLVITGGQTRQIPDGDTLTRASIPVATSSAIGAVQPDNSTITIDGSGVVHATGVSGGCASVSNAACVNANQTFTKAQRSAIVALSLSTSTATPDFDGGQNFSLTLSSACPCTFANPSTTLVPGQAGIIEIDQDGTGSRTVGTWGSEYIAAGGVSTVALSSTASAKDFLSYYVSDTGHIVISMGALNATH